MTKATSTWFARIADLEKRCGLTAEETFALNVEAGAICFLLAASADELAQFDAYPAISSSSPELVRVTLLAKGAVADLRLRGIDASNAKEYFDAKLAALARERQR